MKRTITMAVGALVLFQFLASTALADSKCFSTGPLENDQTETETASTTFWVKALNNNKDDDVDVNIVAFNLNGTKRFLAALSLKNIDPLSSAFTVIGDGDNEELGPQFEVQVSVENGDSDNNNNNNNNNHITVLISGFGKDAAGNLVAAHRLVHSEWTKMNCENFGLIPGAAPAD